MSTLFAKLALGVRPDDGAIAPEFAHVQYFLSDLLGSAHAKALAEEHGFRLDDFGVEPCDDSASGARKLLVEFTETVEAVGADKVRDDDEDDPDSWPDLAETYDKAKAFLAKTEQP